MITEDTLYDLACDLAEDQVGDTIAGAPGHVIRARADDGDEWDDNKQAKQYRRNRHTIFLALSKLAHDDITHSLKLVLTNE